jgi:hypothetical protein
MNRSQMDSIKEKKCKALNLRTLWHDSVCEKKNVKPLKNLRKAFSSNNNNKRKRKEPYRKWEEEEKDLLFFLHELLSWCQEVPPNSPRLNIWHPSLNAITAAGLIKKTTNGRSIPYDTYTPILNPLVAVVECSMISVTTGLMTDSLMMD